MINQEFEKIIKRLAVEVHEIYELIYVATKQKQDPSGPIYLDNKTLCHLIGVSLSTLQRWRRREDNTRLKSYYNQNGNVYYILDEVYELIKSGRCSLAGNGMDRVNALKALEVYKQGIVTGQILG